MKLSRDIRQHGIDDHFRTNKDCSIVAKAEKERSLLKITKKITSISWELPGSFWLDIFVASIFTIHV